VQINDIPVAVVFVLMSLCRALINGTWRIRGKFVNLGNSDAGALISFAAEMVSWGCLVYGVCRLSGVSAITPFDIVAPTVLAGAMFICSNLLLLLQSGVRETAILPILLMLELPGFYILFRAEGYPSHWHTLVSSSDAALGVDTWLLIAAIPVMFIGERVGNRVWQMFLPPRPRGRQYRIAAVFAFGWAGLIGLLATGIAMDVSYQTLLFGFPISHPSAPPDDPFRFLADPSSVVKASVIYQRLIDLLVSLGLDATLSKVISILVTIGGIAQGITVIRGAMKWLTGRHSAFPDDGSEPRLFEDMGREGDRRSH
jgi:hypothetical protein